MHGDIFWDTWSRTRNARGMSCGGAISDRRTEYLAQRSSRIRPSKSSDARMTLSAKAAVVRSRDAWRGREDDMRVGLGQQGDLDGYFSCFFFENLSCRLVPYQSSPSTFELLFLHPRTSVLSSLLLPNQPYDCPHDSCTSPRKKRHIKYKAWCVLDTRVGEILMDYLWPCGSGLPSVIV